jgi:hypothetical protein
MCFSWYGEEEEEEKCSAFLLRFKKVASDKYEKLRERLKEL